MPKASAPVMRGTGHRKKKFGNENQRCAILRCASGVQILMMPMERSVAASVQGAIARAAADTEDEQSSAAFAYTRQFIGGLFNGIGV